MIPDLRRAAAAIFGQVLLSGHARFFSLPRERSERGEGGERSEPGGGSFLFATDVRWRKRPPPLTPPHHSLREWGEGNPTACAQAQTVRDYAA